MTEQENWRALAEQLVQRALRGSIDITEFHNRWALPPQPGTAASVLYEDLEEAIEHFPGTWSGAPDLTAWNASELFRRLTIDLAVLNHVLNDVDLMRIRGLLLNDRNLDLANVAHRINELRRDASRAQ